MLKELAQRTLASARTCIDNLLRGRAFLTTRSSVFWGNLSSSRESRVLLGQIPPGSNDLSFGQFPESPGCRLLFVSFSIPNLGVQRVVPLEHTHTHLCSQTSPRLPPREIIKSPSPSSRRPWGHALVALVKCLFVAKRASEDRKLVEEWSFAGGFLWLPLEYCRTNSMPIR